MINLLIQVEEFIMHAMNGQFPRRPPPLRLRRRGHQTVAMIIIRMMVASSLLQEVLGKPIAAMTLSHGPKYMTILT